MRRKMTKGRRVSSPRRIRRSEAALAVDFGPLASLSTSRGSVTSFLSLCLSLRCLLSRVAFPLFSRRVTYPLCRRNLLPSAGVHIRSRVALSYTLALSSLSIVNQLNSRRRTRASSCTRESERSVRWSGWSGLVC